MSRQEIFDALNEDYPIKADISNNPLGLFETVDTSQQTTPPIVDTAPPITQTTVDTLPPSTPPTDGE